MGIGLILHICQRKMREHPFQLQARQHRELLCHFTCCLRTDTDAAHTRIDFQMDFCLFSLPLCLGRNSLSQFQRADRLRDSTVDEDARILSRNSPKDQDRCRKPRVPELQRLRQNGHSQIISPCLNGRFGYSHSPMSIGIRLDHSAKFRSALNTFFYFLKIMFDCT